MSELDPQVRDLLASLSANPPAQPWEVPIAAYRSAGEELIALAGEPNPRCEVSTAEIDLPGRVLQARTYRPPGRSGELPGVVYFHGGGFVRGSLDSHDRLCRELSVRGELIVVAVAYRLSPEHVFPAAHDDALDSVCWVADHAEELGVARDAMAVAGDSAGAMLAASAALAFEARNSGAPIRAQALLCPVLDATLSSDSVARNDTAPLLSGPVLAWCVDQYFPDVASRDSAVASPLLTPDLAGAPSALLFSAAIDPVCDDGRRYAAGLEAAGVAAELCEYAGMPHSFFLLAGVVDRAEQAIASFAEKLSGLLRSET